MSTSTGIALPVQLVLGSGNQSLLTAVCEDEEPAEVPPPATPDEVTGGSSALRLAPHGAVGVEIDLSEHYPLVRYPGEYRMQWRPLDGRLGVLTAEFRVEPRKDAILVTDHGKLTFALEYDRAPQNVENFLELARDGFYNGKTLHRLIAGFVLQGGCPKEDGTGVRPDGKLIAGGVSRHAGRAGHAAHGPQAQRSGLGELSVLHCIGAAAGVGWSVHRDRPRP